MKRIAALVSLVLIISIVLLFSFWHYISNRLGNEVFNTMLEAKCYTLNRNYPNPDVIIAGDSKVLWQINPKYIGKNAINIGLEQTDIVTSINAIKKYIKNYKKSKIIILGISVYSVNESLKQDDVFRVTAFLKTNLTDHLKMYNLRQLLDRYKQIKALYIRTVFKNGLFHPMQKDYISQLVIDNRGFQGQDGVKTEKFTFTKYWDNFKTNGPITRVTENALEATKLLGPNIVIIITPYKKEWRESNKDIIEKEQVFQRKLYEISGKNKKIIIVNFFNTPFADSLFFDAIHLNRQGANILTRMLVDSLRRTDRAL